MTKRKLNRKGPADVRFWRRVEKGLDCWTWQGLLMPTGYGRMSRADGSTTTAHRFSYELHNGPVDRSLVIDHMCHNRLCVNPAHLRAVEPAANSQNRCGPQSNGTSGMPYSLKDLPLPG